MSLRTQISPSTGTTSLKNMFGDACGSGKNANRELFLCLKDYIIYNIFWLGKSTIIFTYLN